METKALAAAGITVVLWASAFVAIRSAGAEYSPGALALGRLLAGSAVLVVIWLARGGGFPPRAGPGRASSAPACCGSGSTWWPSTGASSSSTRAPRPWWSTSAPIVIALLGGWLLKEGFPRALFAGLAVSFAGAAVVGLSMSEGGGSSVAGVLLCLLAAVSYGVGVVFQKPALRHASALQVTTFGCVVGTVACLPFAGQLVAEASTASLGATLNVVYLGVFPTALAFTTWAYALARTTSGKMGATTYVTPALVVLMSWVALGEVPGWLTLLGGLLCLVGVGVSRMRPRRLSGQSVG
ncbi:DMT family transporter [Nonomuraea dietziae]|uniref:DMT family transporter n=1 Tax=Nonomuraea dietziae TaxID=65515 RepID=UPI0031E101D8